VSVTTAAPLKARPAIVGYVFARGAAIRPDEIAAEKLTHLNFAFADLRAGRLVEADPGDAANLAVLTGLRKRNPELRVLVSAGGWVGSKGFSDVALTAGAAAPVRTQRRRAPATARPRRPRPRLGVSRLPGNGNRHRPATAPAFSALLADLRRALDEEAPRASGRLLLTIAAGAFAGTTSRTSTWRRPRPRSTSST